VGRLSMVITDSHPGPKTRVCLACFTRCFCERDKKFAPFSPSTKLCIVKGKDTLKATRVSWQCTEGVLHLANALKSNLIYSCQRGLLEEMKGRGQGGRID